MPALLSAAYRQECLWQAQVSMPEIAPSEVPANADVVVVGAGYCGLSAAASAAAAGASVLVFDSEPLGWGASSRNGGMVIPELKKPPEALAKKIGPLAYRLYDELHEAFDFVEAAAASSDYTRTGQLLLAHSPRHVPGLQELARQLEDVRFLGAAEVFARTGSREFVAGAFFERVGGLHPAKFHAHLARAAIGAGATIHDRTAVASVQRLGGAFEVTTTRGTVRADQVVVATNAYSDAAVPDVGAQVLPINSYVIATEPLPAEARAEIGAAMMIDTRTLLHYWRLSPDGRMVFGGRRSMDPVDIPVARDYLYEQMVRFHPVLTGVAVDYAWTGYVAMTVDRLPHVGTTDDGAWFAVGCNGSGVCLNTWLGHRLGQVVTGQASPPAFAELKQPKIPMKSLSPAYLPIVGRYFAATDRR